MSAQQAGAASAALVDFQRQVRPILSDNCFHCHGPDEATRMVGLRLDTQEGAFEKRESGSVIVAGNPNGSLLYQRITATDAAQRMPPESSHKVLTDDQKKILKNLDRARCNMEAALVFCSCNPAVGAGGQRPDMGEESN